MLFHVCPLPLPSSSIIFNLNIRLRVRLCSWHKPFPQTGRGTCQVDPGCNLLDAIGSKNLSQRYRRHGHLEAFFKGCSAELNLDIFFKSVMGP